MVHSTGSYDRFLKEGGGIDFRLNQNRWSSLKESDVIEFVDESDEKKRYDVIILKLYKANSFEDLLDNLPDELFDKSRKADYLDFFAQWWSSEQEAREGVLGLHIEVLN